MMATKHFLLFYEACDDYVARRAPFRDLHLKHGWAAPSPARSTAPSFRFGERRRKRRNASRKAIRTW